MAVPRWVPQFLKFGENRFRSQLRLLGLAALVGVVAGLGAIVFYVATQVVEYYALGSLAGYHAARAGGFSAWSTWRRFTSSPSRRTSVRWSWPRT